MLLLQCEIYLFVVAMMKLSVLLRVRILVPYLYPLTVDCYVLVKKQVIEFVPS